MTSKAPREAAGIVLRRRGDGAVFIGTRTHKARSWPGTLAFPGGSVDDDDDVVPTLDSSSPDRRHLRVAACREALEEAGLVRLARPDGSAAPAAAVEAVRQGLAGETPFSALLAAQGLVVDDRGLIDLGSWWTAEGSFLVARFLWLVDEAPARVLPPTEELDALGFIGPVETMAGWRAGEVFLPPPIRIQLGRLAALVDAGDDDVIAGLCVAPSEAERRRRDIISGVVLFDPRTPTLPPATRTNCVVIGHGDVLLVDPATPWEEERAAFDDALHTILEGRRVQGIVLTHHHHDHIGDVERLRVRHGCPVFAHEATVARVPFAVDHVVDDGHVFQLDAGPLGGPLAFEAVWTPGHAPGHLCLFERHLRVLIAGDMIAGVGSILIDPDDGHMATYLASLERLIALSPRSLIPAHGPLLVDAVGRLEEQRQHRLAREAMVRAAVEGGASEVEGIVLAVYGADTPTAMLPFAALSVRSIVQKLAEDGVVDVVGDRVHPR